MLVDEGYSPPVSHSIFVAGERVNTTTWMPGLPGVTISSIVGWIGQLPDMRDGREPRAAQDGERARVQLLGGRTVTLHGVVHGSSHADLQARKLQLARALAASIRDEVLLKVPLPDADPDPLVAYADDGMTGFERALVRIVDYSVEGKRVGLWSQEWIATYRASDPRIYLDVETVSSSSAEGSAPRVATVDGGDVAYETPMLVEIDGPAVSPMTVTAPVAGFAAAIDGMALAGDERLLIDSRFGQRVMTFLSSFEGVRLRMAGVAALWMLDDTTGTVMRNSLSPASPDGEYVGSPVKDQEGSKPGVPVVSFPDGTAYATAAHFAALDDQTWSLELNDVTPTGIVGEQVIARHGTLGVDGWALAITPTGALRFYSPQAAGSFGVANPSFASSTAGWSGGLPGGSTASVLTRDTGVFHSGPASLRVQRPAANPPSFAGVVAAAPMSGMLRGRSYRARAFLRGTGAASGGSPLTGMFVAGVPHGGGPWSYLTTETVGAPTVPGEWGETYTDFTVFGASMTPYLVAQRGDEVSWSEAASKYLNVDSVTLEQLTPYAESAAGIMAPGESYHVLITKTPTQVTIMVNAVTRLQAVAASLVPAPGEGLVLAESLSGKLGPVMLIAGRAVGVDEAQLLFETPAQAEIDASGQLDPLSSRWGLVPRGGDVFTLNASGLDAGSQLTVRHRGARL